MNLFPATPERPETAFTFAALATFRMHNLQSKVTAFDWIVSLRRMTEGISTPKVAVSEAIPDTENVLTSHQDPYKAFLRVSRVWEHINLKLHSGSVHDIAKILTSRPPKSIISFCPACSEPGVNMFPGWEDLTKEEEYVFLLRSLTCSD
jgi:hypothetical protein